MELTMQLQFIFKTEIMRAGSKGKERDASAARMELYLFLLNQDIPDIRSTLVRSYDLEKSRVETFFISLFLVSTLHRKEYKAALLKGRGC